MLSPEPLSALGAFDVVLDRAAFHTLYLADSRSDGLVAQLYLFHLLSLLRQGGYLLIKAMDMTRKNIEGIMMEMQRKIQMHNTNP